MDSLSPHGQKRSTGGAASASAHVHGVLRLVEYKGKQGSEDGCVIGCVDGIVVLVE